MISLMDGNHTVEQLWELANQHLGDEAPSQDELIQLLGQLHSADLLESDVTPDVAEAFARGEREERARHFRSYANPMAIRIPLFDPDRLLNRCSGLLRLIWSGWGALVWLAVVLPAFVLIWPHWPELTHNFSDRVLAGENLLVLYLVFPLIKALHEFGHASATKAGGGEVHDLGIILLVLLPVPYCDASAATVFRSKYRRALVGAAGMGVELFVAAISFYLWLLIEPGLVRAVLFNVMLIASVSTLLFNGNPLLRYDAYYILVDLIEMPNLAARSARYWGYLIERYVLCVSEAERPEGSRTERVWFAFYGLASTLYRITVTIMIAWCSLQGNSSLLVFFSRSGQWQPWRSFRSSRRCDTYWRVLGCASIARVPWPLPGAWLRASRLSCSRFPCLTIRMLKACCGCRTRRWSGRARTASFVNFWLRPGPRLFAETRSSKVMIRH
ncbi:hypothetical protein [Bradyrhizobium sp. JR3.5]